MACEVESCEHSSDECEYVSPVVTPRPAYESPNLTPDCSAEAFELAGNETEVTAMSAEHHREPETKKKDREQKPKDKLHLILPVPIIYQNDPYVKWG